MALAFCLYGLKVESILERLKAARVDVTASIEMSWDAECVPELLNKVFFPLAFIAKYGKAYTRFITHKEEVD